MRESTNKVQNPYTSLYRLQDFVERTESYGVPYRVAVNRAARRFRVSRSLVAAFTTPASAPQPEPKPRKSRRKG